MVIVKDKRAPVMVPREAARPGKLGLEALGTLCYVNAGFLSVQEAWERLVAENGEPKMLAILYELVNAGYVKQDGPDTYTFVWPELQERPPRVPNLREQEACCLCGKRAPLINHHISYIPEITIRICHLCHRRIHDGDPQFAHLRPEMSRAEWEFVKAKKKAQSGKEY